jgi:hypothetical protein
MMSRLKLEALFTQDLNDFDSSSSLLRMILFFFHLYRFPAKVSISAKTTREV